MLSYIICEIGGKQVKVLPNKPFEIDLQPEAKEFTPKILLISEEGKIRVGKPYIEEKIKLTFLENIKADKIRVAKFHAKANYRRVTGQRPKKTKVVYSVKK